MSLQPDWSAVEIYERGKEMLDFLGRRWGVKFDGWEYEKYDALNLGFVNPEAEGSD